MAQLDDPTAGNHPPKEDGNFMLVVIFAGIALIIGFIVAFLIISGAGKHLVPGRHDPHPTSQLIVPAVKHPPATWQQTNES
jgi:hypothetical protein